MQEFTIFVFIIEEPDIFGECHTRVDNTEEADGHRSEEHQFPIHYQIVFVSQVVSSTATVLRESRVYATGGSANVVVEHIGQKEGRHYRYQEEKGVVEDPVSGDVDDGPGEEVPGLQQTERYLLHGYATRGHTFSHALLFQNRVLLFPQLVGHPLDLQRVLS